MKTIHTKQIDSTQSLLKNELSHKNAEKENILITTENQLSGRGRGENNWVYQNESLAFSFNLNPHNILTLTSLEIGVLVNSFIQKNFNIQTSLKWPNDLMISHHEKFGGILMECLNSTLVCGIGINLGPIHNDQNNFKIKAGFLKIEKSQNYKQEIPQQIYQYILNNRLTTQEILELWNKNCCHLNRPVEIHDNREVFSGVFKEVLKNGQALIETERGRKEVYTGSLVIL